MPTSKKFRRNRDKLSLLVLPVANASLSLCAKEGAAPEHANSYKVCARSKQICTLLKQPRGWGASTRDPLKAAIWPLPTATCSRYLPRRSFRLPFERETRLANQNRSSHFNQLPPRQNCCPCSERAYRIRAQTHAAPLVSVFRSHFFGFFGLFERNYRPPQLDACPGAPAWLFFLLA